jgi:hypothetical protein
VLSPLGVDDSTAAPYKPDPQAWYHMEKMVESKKTVVNALFMLIEIFTSLEKKADSYVGDLGKVQAQLKLVMQSIFLV